MNLQAVPCPQCKGDGFIDIEEIDWDKIKWWHILTLCSPYPKNKRRETCGYCKTKGFVAVDVDSLVVISRREDHE